MAVVEGSAAQQAAQVLPDSRVVAAFHHVSAVLLLDEKVDTRDTDVLVLGDDREGTDLVQALVELVPGLRGVEALTANLISVNRRYKAHAGLRVTDVWWRARRCRHVARARCQPSARHPNVTAVAARGGGDTATDGTAESDDGLPAG